MDLQPLFSRSSSIHSRAMDYFAPHSASKLRRLMLGFKSATGALWQRCDPCEQRLRDRIGTMTQKVTPIDEVSYHAAYAHVLNVSDYRSAP